MSQTQKPSAPAEIPHDIRALAEKPLMGPAPAGTVPMSDGPKIDALLDKAQRSLDSYSLDEIAMLPPDKALQILDLREKLERAKKLSSEREIEAASKIRMLQEIVNNTAAEREWQKACEQRGHAGERGEPIISGQTDSAGTHRLICPKCNKVFVGIGSEPGQLPIFIANHVNWENIGKSH